MGGLILIIIRRRLLGKVRKVREELLLLRLHRCITLPLQQIFAVQHGKGRAPSILRTMRQTVQDQMMIL